MFRLSYSNPRKNNLTTKEEVAFDVQVGIKRLELRDVEQRRGDEQKYDAHRETCTIILRIHRAAESLEN